MDWWIDVGVAALEVAWLGTLIGVALLALVDYAGRRR